MKTMKKEYAKTHNVEQQAKRKENFNSQGIGERGIAGMEMTSSGKSYLFVLAIILVLLVGFYYMWSNLFTEVPTNQKRKKKKKTQ